MCRSTNPYFNTKETQWNITVKQHRISELDHPIQGHRVYPRSYGPTKRCEATLLTIAPPSYPQRGQFRFIFDSKLILTALNNYNILYASSPPTPVCTKDWTLDISPLFTLSVIFSNKKKKYCIIQTQKNIFLWSFLPWTRAVLARGHGIVQAGKRGA